MYFIFLKNNFNPYLKIAGLHYLILQYVIYLSPLGCNVEMVIGSDFEAEARNFALLQSLYIFVYYAQWEISAFSSHKKEWIFLTEYSHSMEWVNI